jgi:hypothetical protein
MIMKLKNHKPGPKGAVEPVKKEHIFKEEYMSPTKLPVTLLSTLIITTIESGEQTNSHRKLQTASVICEINVWRSGLLSGSGVGPLSLLQNTP